MPVPASSDSSDADDLLSDDPEGSVITDDMTDDDFDEKADDFFDSSDDPDATQAVAVDTSVEDADDEEAALAPAIDDAGADPYLPPELAAPVIPAAAPLPMGKTAAPTWRDRRAASRLRARKVRRLVRHIEPWSMLKISLLFYFCLWIILLVAGVLLWGAAVSSGTIDNIENFIRELLALDEFEFDADLIFRSSALGGLVLVVAATGFNVLLAVLFNLISDLTGGMRITVVEEESARMFARPARRPRRGAPVSTAPLATAVVPEHADATP